MKSFYAILVFFILLSSCSTPSSRSSKLPDIENTQFAELAKVKTVTPIDTSTPKPTSTNTSSPTTTRTATITSTPSVTLTPTEVLPFYNVAACLPKNTLTQRGTVTQINDGDTIYVLLEDGKTYTIRYIGVDAPENDAKYFTESFNANSDLVLQKDVILIKDVSETDQFDRLLRYVIVGDVFVNQELVRNGFAKAVSYPPDISCADTFTLAEDEARGSQMGMWVATPTPKSSSPTVIVVSVNKREEWVEIQNAGNSDVDLAGWNLVSERGHQECYLSGIIKSGEILRIWAGTAQGSGFSCGYSNPIWNNSEPDPAVLYNAQGVEVSRK